VFELVPPVVEVLGERGVQLTNAVVSPIGAAVEPAVGRVPDDIASEEGERSLEASRA
jgi:hypothetical protein